MIADINGIQVGTQKTKLNLTTTAQMLQIWRRTLALARGTLLAGLTTCGSTTAR